MPKTIHVKATTNAELTEKWGFNPQQKGLLYIRCNSKGAVNWDKAPVYTALEIYGRPHIKIIN
jgi:hypothetical protein